MITVDSPSLIVLQEYIYYVAAWFLRAVQQNLGVARGSVFVSNLPGSPTEC